MIFVLDDDPLTLKMISKALAELGEIRAVSLWSEIGSELLQPSEEPHVLVCDLQMPGINGLTFCEIVRRYSGECRIVIYSAAVEDHPPTELNRLADVVVRKQEGLGALVAKVEGLLAS